MRLNIIAFIVDAADASCPFEGRPHHEPIILDDGPPVAIGHRLPPLIDGVGRLTVEAVDWQRAATGEWEARVRCRGQVVEP